MCVKEKGDSNGSSKMIDGDEKMVNEPQTILLALMKIPQPFSQGLKRKLTMPSSKFSYKT